MKRNFFWYVSKTTCSSFFKSKRSSNPNRIDRIIEQLMIPMGSGRHILGSNVFWISSRVFTTYIFPLRLEIIAASSVRMSDRDINNLCGDDGAMMQGKKCHIDKDNEHNLTQNWAVYSSICSSSSSSSSPSSPSSISSSSSSAMISSSSILR